MRYDISPTANVNKTTKLQYTNKGVKTVYGLETTACHDTLDFLKICQLIQSRTTMTVEEVEMAVATLAEIMAEAFGMGRGVDLGELGTFYPRLIFKSCEKAEDVTIKNIKGMRIAYFPHKDMKKLLKDITYVVKDYRDIMVSNRSKLAEDNQI